MPVSPAPQKPRRLLILIVALALVIVVLVAVLLWWPEKSDRSLSGQSATTSDASRESLPEALQPGESSTIDNSDILASASDTAEAETASPDQAPAINRFTMMIRNRSSAVDPVDIKITLDGRVIVDENFKYGSQIKLGDGVEVLAPGLDWKQLPLKLAVGSHQIKVESLRGIATWNADFTTTDKEWWASLEYVDGQKFDWELSERPLLPL